MKGEKATKRTQPRNNNEMKIMRDNACHQTCNALMKLGAGWGGGGWARSAFEVHLNILKLIVTPFGKGDRKKSIRRWGTGVVPLIA